MKKIIFLSVLSLCLFLTACTNAVTQPVESFFSSQAESSINENQSSSEQSQTESSVDERENLSEQSQTENESSCTTPESLEFNESSEIEENSRPNKEGKFLYGIVFLGYESDEGEITPPYAYIDMEQFKQMESVMYEGDEYYLIVPVNKDVKVEIFAFNANDPIGGIGECLYQSESGVPVLLRCNLSDIHVNTVIRFENKDLFASYSPYINLMDNTVVIEDGGYLLKLIEIPIYDNSTADFDYATALVEVVGEDYLEGRALMRVDDQEIFGNICAVFKVGTNTEEKFTTEDWIAVSENGNVYSYDVCMDEWSEYKRSN